jgi:farnesyl-diphosphate farnesyltransferase
MAAYLLVSMQSAETSNQLLHHILPRVSRSFYLSLRVLPQTIRPTIGLAYLFCRAADTIADTALLPRAQRQTCLDHYRSVFAGQPLSTIDTLQQHLSTQQQNPSERELLVRLPECLRLFAELPNGDQQHIRHLVLTLTQGMLLDLTVFPGENEGGVQALETRADLDLYTYLVAGCVGEFWTRVTMSYVPSVRHWDAWLMEARGIRFGKGLQLTNILRDIAPDLRLGRCYLPRTELAMLGVQPQHLLNSDAVGKVRPLLDELLDLTLSHYREGWAYTLAIPRREWRLRLACAWPLLIGLSTLALVRRSQRLLDPQARVKIARTQVYGIMLRSLVSVWSDRALKQYYDHLLARSGFVANS